METIMRIECEECREIIGVTGRTVNAPFVCDECVRNTLPTSCDPCDTASIENTTLLIEDLQQQLQNARQTIIILKTQNAFLNGRVDTLMDEKRPDYEENDV